MTEKINSRPALIGLPWDINSSFLRGAAEAPPLIRSALFSDAGHLWREAGVNLGVVGMLHDAGDVQPDTDDMNFTIEAAITSLLNRIYCQYRLVAIMPSPYP